MVATLHRLARRVQGEHPAQPRAAQSGDHSLRQPELRETRHICEQPSCFWRCCMSEATGCPCQQLVHQLQPHAQAGPHLARV
jgi:hypothetical protein